MPLRTIVVQPKLTAEALREVRKANAAIITTLFQGKQLEFRTSKYQQLLEEKIGVTDVLAPKKFDKLSEGKAIADVPIAAMELAKALLATIITPGPTNATLEGVEQALEGVMPGFMVELGMSLVPFAGVITSGASTLITAATTAHKAWKVHCAELHAAGSLAHGDSEKAMEAVTLLLARARNTGVTKLGIGIGEFAGKVAGLFADGATISNAVIGLAGAIARLVILIRAIVVDIEEKNAGNMLIKDGNISSELFRLCPIMGAYMVLCAPTSALCNGIFNDDRFFYRNMQASAEEAISQHVNPMRIEAKSLIDEHRMYFKDMKRLY